MPATNEKVYEKYAWIIPFAIGLIFLPAAVPHMLGVNTDPSLVEDIIGMTEDEFEDAHPTFFDLYTFYLSGGGLSDLGVAFFIITISLTAYRRGEKWAWYAFWFIPAFFLGFVAINFSIDAGPSLLLPLTLFVILSLLGLLLPYRKFFPSKTSLNAAFYVRYGTIRIWRVAQ
jgi:hypothetical protein